ncbi:MAG TPA: RagB/SusD family nutrient uptake outer membrane protein [Arachidicoccus sp.]|nr:RagB/SusD family nutrient uptake outer membrane protein [Arachidicoccus sp.]
MKIKIIIVFIGLALLSCNKLDLNPLTRVSTDNLYTSESGIVNGINNLYVASYWCSSVLDDKSSSEYPDSWTDDWTNRNLLSVVTDGSLNGQSGIASQNWNLRYECIANANIVSEYLEKLSSEIEDKKLEKYRALVKFARAYQYSLLIFYYGDVPYYEKVLSIDDAFTIGRTKKEEILKSIYADLDYAAANLPPSYTSSELKYPTKGAALAIKARVALHMNDWKVVRDASKACMELKVYELLPDFNDVLTNKKSAENILARPRSAPLNVIINATKANQLRTRTPGGTDFHSPSWDLFCAFLCTDGLPIDKSPLYNARRPFDNRDPRCAATITEFGTRHLGVVYEPHPDSATVFSYTAGTQVKNNDSKINTQWASFNGIVWNKGITEQTWLNTTTVDPDDILLRYADVLLMYAEAKIELNEIDQSVLDAINMVRARAYGVNYNSIDGYPKVTLTNRENLRKIIRIERRMEFALESLRYYDIIRWKIADKVLNKPIYGLLDINELRAKIVKPGLWFFPAIPTIDDDGVANFKPMYENGLIKLLANRVFDPSKQYLWPIPTSEVQINPNIKQNDNY